MNKVNILLLLVIVLFCWVGKVQSKDEAKSETSGKSTKTEPTNAPKDDKSVPIIDITETAEYKNFEKALENTNEDACLDHLIIISLNLLRANQTGISHCEDKYAEKLVNYRKTKPCKEKSNRYQYAAEYMDNHIQLLCHEYDSNKDLIESGIKGEGKILCPLINTLKSNNSTLYQTTLLESCNSARNTTTNGSCINNILQNYKNMEDLFTNPHKLNGEHSITYESSNNDVTITFNIDYDVELYNALNSKETGCKHYQNDITAGAVSTTISFTTILLFSMFIIFINM